MAEINLNIDQNTSVKEAVLILEVQKLRRELNETRIAKGYEPIVNWLQHDNVKEISLPYRTKTFQLATTAEIDDDVRRQITILKARTFGVKDNKDLAFSTFLFKDMMFNASNETIYDFMMQDYLRLIREVAKTIRDYK